MNSRHLIERFATSRDAGEPLVLVTVCETLGSTYSKAGARMLITHDGKSQGLVSGGCLEGDLAERARSVLASNAAATVTYDLRDEADELFGLGIGCNGLIRVLLQPLTPEGSYEPMASIAEVLLGGMPGAIASIIDSSRADLPVGASVVLVDDSLRGFGVSKTLLEAFAKGCSDAETERCASLADEPDGARILYAPLLPVPRILVLGAGVDAIPLINIISEIGWRVTIADHRPGYLERAGFQRAEARVVVTAQSLGKDLNLGDFDAIVVMSHHLATDREYLRQLAGVEARYIGLLGPPARKRRLVDELGDDGRRLATRLRGPVGIDIGADTAESIAVSIAAEIQKVLVTVA